MHRCIFVKSWVGFNSTRVFLGARRLKMVKKTAFLIDITSCSEAKLTVNQLSVSEILHLENVLIPSKDIRKF